MIMNGQGALFMIVAHTSFLSRKICSSQPGSSGRDLAVLYWSRLVVRKNIIRSSFLAVSLIASTTPAVFALPQGGTIISGAAVITNPAPNILQISQQTDTLTIAWAQFNIASGEAVVFVQPSGSSMVQNQVAGPISLSGTLSANGQLVMTCVSCSITTSGPLSLFAGSAGSFAQSTGSLTLSGGAVTALTGSSGTARPITISENTPFTVADLAGTWRLYGLAGAAKSGTEGEWIVGTLVFDTIGELTDGTITWADGVVTTLTSGFFHVAGSGMGRVQGNIQFTGRFGPFQGMSISANMTQNKQVLVGVLPPPSDVPPDFQTSETFFSLVVLVKESTQTFYPTDLSGNWRTYGLGTPRLPAVEPVVTVGILKIDGSGTLGTFAHVDGAIETLGGQLAVTADGHISGSITSGEDRTALQATLSSDKKLLVAVGTTRTPRAESSRDLIIFLRDEPLALSDLAGTWHENDLSLSVTQGNVGRSGLGDILFNSAGNLITGGLVSENISSGTLSINPNGFLVGAYNSTTGLSTMAATVVPSLEMMVGLIAKKVNVQTLAPQEAALAILVRDPGMDPKVLAQGSLAPSIVVPGAEASARAEHGPGNLADWIGLYRVGADDTAFIDWQYLNGEKTLPIIGRPFASLLFTMPNTPGAYEFRYFENGGHHRLATSALVTIPDLPALIIRVLGSLARVTGEGINCSGECWKFYPLGSGSVTLTATPDFSNVKFLGWSGEGCSGTGTCTVTMNTIRTVSATFLDTTLFTINVFKLGAGNGTVTSVPAGINCGTTCIMNTYGVGPSVTLTAVADHFSEFVGWSEACSGTGTCTVTTSTARSVTAIFNQAQPTLTLTPTKSTVAAGGSIAVTLEGGSGSDSCITLTDASEYSPASYVLLHGQSTGVVAFTAPTTPGSYVFRYWAQCAWPPLATSVPFTVTVQAAAAPTMTLTPSQSTVVAGGSITVNLQGGSGSDSCITLTDTSGYSPASHVLLHGQSTGVVPFTAPITPGSYVFRYWAQCAWPPLATSAPFTVTAQAAAVSTVTVTPTQSTVATGGSITVNLQGGNGNDCITLTDTSGYSPASYVLLNGQSNGLVPFTAPTTPGTYVFRYWARCVWPPLVTSVPFTVTVQAVAGPTMTLTPTQSSVAVGGSITVNLQGGSGPDCITLTDTSGYSPASYVLLNGQSNGLVAFTAPTTPGSYVFRYWALCVWPPLMTSVPFTVTD